MTDGASNVAPNSVAASAQGRFQLGPFAALLVASVIAGLAAWLLLLPVREPAALVRSQPRPELLDKPHRHLAAPAPDTAAPKH